MLDNHKSFEVAAQKRKLRSTWVPPLRWCHSSLWPSMGLDNQKPAAPILIKPYMDAWEYGFISKTSDMSCISNGFLPDSIHCHNSQREPQPLLPPALPSVYIWKTPSLHQQSDHRLENPSFILGDTLLSNITIQTFVPPFQPAYTCFFPFFPPSVVLDYWS